MAGIDDFDDEPNEPEEGDLVTEDHIDFYQYGKHVLHIPDGQDMDRAVREFMDEQQFWPDVWWVSDHGNPHLLNISQEA
jgi:hypothetical protein